MIDKRFIIAVLVMLIIWFSFFAYLINYGESVRKNPCKVCAERMGEDMICTNMNYKVVFEKDGNS